MFPFRLTSIEKYHFFDDSPEFPNNFFARIVFEGALDRSLLMRAFELAADRHVRKNAIVVASGRRLVWDDCRDPRPRLEILTKNEFEFQPLDIQKAPAYLAKCFIGTEQSTMIIQVHHALTDGLGGMAFLRDCFSIYDNLFHGRDDEAGMPVVDKGSLKKRNRIGLATWSYLKNIWRQPIALFGATKFLVRPFQTIKSIGKQTANPSQPGRVECFPSTVSFAIDRSQLKTIKKSLAKYRVTLNDFLLATLFQALNRWPNSQSTKNCWRIIVPISIRSRDEYSMPVANRTTLIQLDRFPNQTQDVFALAQGIHIELGVIRGWYLDRIFLLAIRAMSLSSAWLRSNARQEKPRATTLLTNMGKPFLRQGADRSSGRIVVGETEISEIELIPPIRASLPLSLAAIQYAGDLKITAHVDTRFLELGEVQNFVEIWKSSILSVI